MKRSFTLIEVLVAVVILALVGAALIKNGSDAIDVLEKVRNKAKMSDYIALFANHRHQDYNHLTKALEDFLEFRSADDELRKLLKQKFTYREDILKIKMHTLEGFDQNEDGEQQNPLNINFVKVSFRNEKGGDFFYLLDLNE